MISTMNCDRVRTLFLQGVSLSFGIAFYSLYTQIPGLYGDKGILPASTQLDFSRLETEDFLSLFMSKPTLLWLTPKTGLTVPQCMELLCLSGTILSVLITILPYFLTKLSLFILWLSYLSVYQVGQTFLWFQWDILLLETGFLAIIAAPLMFGYQKRPLPYDHISLYLVRWLLFRMMFASGCVKLTSGCPTWWGLTAMPTHYFSQCIPTSLAWYATNWVPDWFHRLSVAGTFIIEIPFTALFFAPCSGMRRLTFVHQILLMVLIMLSGNYNFFNFLYIVLCLSLADNSWLPGHKKEPQHRCVRWCVCLFELAALAAFGHKISTLFGLRLHQDTGLPDASIKFTASQFDEFLSMSVPISIYVGAAGLALAILISLRNAFFRYTSAKRKNAARGLGFLARLATVAMYGLTACIMFGLSLPSYTGQLDRPTWERVPALIKALDRQLDPFQLTSSYGLFRRMTGVGGRPELIIEGSRDGGATWLEYEFPYKPGRLDRAPTFCLPHQPRLDWQMWFAALGTYRQNPWLLSLVYRLLQGEPDVLKLMDPKSNFCQGESPPELIRAKLYTYNFTSSYSDTAWWTRVEEMEYLPPVSLKDGQLEAFMTSQGYLVKDSKSNAGLVGIRSWLATIRRLTDSGPPAHVQIWSFAWLALPLLKPFF